MPVFNRTSSHTHPISITATNYKVFRADLIKVSVVMHRVPDLHKFCSVTNVILLLLLLLLLKLLILIIVIEKQLLNVPEEYGCLGCDICGR
jgi:hypothetical protein